MPWTVCWHCSRTSYYQRALLRLATDVFVCAYVWVCVHACVHGKMVIGCIFFVCVCVCTFCSSWLFSHSKLVEFFSANIYCDYIFCCMCSTCTCTCSAWPENCTHEVVVNVLVRCTCTCRWKTSLLMEVKFHCMLTRPQLWGEAICEGVNVCVHMCVCVCVY